MREVIISQRTLAHSLAYMQWDPTMPLENLKNTSHHIHIFIMKIVYHFTHLANFFLIPKLRSFFFCSTSSKGTCSKTLFRTFSKFSTSFSRIPDHSPCSTHIN